MKFNHTKFFLGFKRDFDDTLEQSQVDGIEFLLTSFENEPLWKDVRHIAYAFATTFHETAGSMQPVEEGYYLARYGASRVKSFQKSLRYYPYFGRGYVQLTWKKNYQKASDALGIDFIANPNALLDQRNSFQILTYGMFEGWFTTKKLSDYISGSKCDYTNARKIINGLDKAGLIAGYARTFEKILKDSAAVPSTAASTQTTMLEPATSTETNQPVSAETNSSQPPIESKETLGEFLDNYGKNNQPAELTPPILPPDAVVEVEQISAAKDEPKKEDFITRMSNRFIAIPQMVLTAIGAAIMWLTSAPLHFVLALVSASVLIALVYMTTTSIRNAGKEKREMELKKIREAQAFELQKITLLAAASQTQYAVKITQPPATEIPNSDAPEGG